MAWLKIHSRSKSMIAALQKESNEVQDEHRRTLLLYNWRTWLAKRKLDKFREVSSFFFSTTAGRPIWRWFNSSINHTLTSEACARRGAASLYSMSDIQPRTRQEDGTTFRRWILGKFKKSLIAAFTRKNDLFFRRFRHYRRRGGTRADRYSRMEPRFPGDRTPRIRATQATKVFECCWEVKKYISEEDEEELEKSRPWKRLPWCVDCWEYPWQ